MFNLRKVDFIWINRDQKSFEWFVNLLSQLEAEQQEHGAELDRFLEKFIIIIIITTRPKPAYGRQGLAGSWGQNTDKVSNFWVFLTSHFAQLRIKPTWDHS